MLYLKEMKDTSLDASIIDEAADDVKEDKESDVFKNGQKDGDKNNLDTQKKVFLLRRGSVAASMELMMEKERPLAVLR